MLDWRQNCLSLRYGAHIRQCPLSEIQQLVLSTRELTASSGTSSSNSSKANATVSGYQCRLDAFLPQADVVVIGSEQAENTSAKAQEALAPLGSLLARELQVPFSLGQRGKTDTDAGELIYFQADETTVSDASVAPLREQTKLRFVFIRGTLVTPEGRKQLYSDWVFEVFR